MCLLFMLHTQQKMPNPHLVIYFFWINARQQVISFNVQCDYN